jgi:hypothetical protein
MKASAHNIYHHMTATYLAEDGDLVTECIHSFPTNPSLCAILLSNVLDDRMVKQLSDPKHRGCDTQDILH